MLNNRIKWRLVFAAVSTLISATAAANAQQRPSDTTLARSSAAYAEIVLRRTEFEAELESLILEYTEEFPKVKELRQGIILLNREADRLLAVKPEGTGKLTLALGKLMTRKVDAELDLWRLQQSYADGHPDVKRSKRKVEIYEKAIKEILG